MKYVILVAIVIALSRESAPAQSIFTTQNRSITATGQAIVGNSTTTNSQTLTAPDFSTFNQTASQTANTPVGTAPASGTGTASQNSSLLAQGLMASSSVTASGAGTFPTSSGEGQGSSTFQTTFTLQSPAAIVIQVGLGAHRNEDGSLSGDPVATALFSLVGGPINVQVATSLTSGKLDSTAFFSNTLDFPAGNYTLSISANADAFGAHAGASGDGMASANYSAFITPFVPEPTSLALALTALVSLPLLGGRLRRRID